MLSNTRRCSVTVWW